MLLAVRVWHFEKDSYSVGLNFQCNSQQEEGMMRRKIIKVMTDKIWGGWSLLSTIGSCPKISEEYGQFNVFLLQQSVTSTTKEV